MNMRYFILFNHIFKSKIKIKFNRIEKNKIIVFDGVSYPDLEFLLEDFNFFILENRLERIKELNFSFFTIYKIIFQNK